MRLSTLPRHLSHGAGSINPKGQTVTPHPTVHPQYLLTAAWEIYRNPQSSELSLQQLMALYRDGAGDLRDAACAPSPEQEWDCQLLALRIIMTQALDEPEDFDHVNPPRTWIGRDHDGTGLGVGVQAGVLGRVRAAEIVAVCNWILEKLPATAIDAHMFVVEFRRTAKELGALAQEELSPEEFEVRRADLVRQLDLSRAQRGLLDVLEPGRLADTVRKFGLGGFEGELRIASADVGTPKMHALLDEIAANAPMEAVSRLVVADCDSPARLAVLQQELANRGLEQVEVIPLFESPAQLQLLFDGAYDASGAGEYMIAGSDYPKYVGTARAVLDTDEFLRYCEDHWIQAYHGAGHDAQRSGCGNSPTALDVIVNSGPKAARRTVQGPVALLQLSSKSFHQKLLDSGGRVHTSEEDHHVVAKCFAPIIDVEQRDRQPDQRFAQIYRNSHVPSIEFPPAGSRDLQKKKTDAGAGPYQSRAIAVNNRLKFADMVFGVGYGDIRPETLDALVAGIQDIKRAGTPGAQHLVDKIMYSYAMQAGMFGNMADLKEMWEALGCSEDDRRALGQSVQTMMSLLERTGYDLVSNLTSQKMVMEDYGMDYSPHNPAANWQQIQGRAHELHRHKLRFLRKEPGATYFLVELYSQIRRS